MKVMFTDDFNKCIYSKEICLKIKNRAELSDIDDVDYNTYYAIYGDDVPKDIKFPGNAKVNECTAYVFYIKNETYVPVRATYSAKTLANFARAEKKFGHLRPENEL